MTARIAVVDYGSGNLHSVSRALARVGGDVVVSADADVIRAAAAVLIPGVGHFGQCVRALRAAGLEDVVREVVGTGRPVVGVCVGMQILFETSDEDLDPGLGLLPGRVRRLATAPTVKVPHMGWNTVSWTGRRHPLTAGIPDGTHFYFVHSYAPDLVPDTVGAAEHGRAFAAAVARDNVFAVQFHPEKSGDAGLQLYENLVKEVVAA
ncbi:MAG TPA: imidazole glycerol phosphate synthase subunit HisH [Actinomycetota bacterium]